MIRINLAKTHNYSSAGTQTAAAMEAGSSLGTPHPGVKIALMLVATLMVYAYETYNLNILQKQLNAKNAQLAEIQKKVEQFGPVTNVVEGLIKEKARLDGQLQVLSNISKKRAFKLKAIRQVQESVLEDLWLSEMTVDQNLLNFKGYSRSPTSVQRIVENLNSADFIESAINKELRREDLNGEKLNSFDIEAKVTQ